MSNPFTSLNIGLKALQTQKKSLDVTGHNIANANNKNYSRQRAVHSATDPYPVPGINSPAGAGQVGTGVKISEIKRMRDQFIDGQIREETQKHGQWSRLQQGLHRIELIMNEPSQSGLNTAMEKFWQSLQDLSNHPEDSATRSTVRQRGMGVVNTFHNLYDQLQDYKKSLDSDFASTVKEVNSLGQRIADLNQQIDKVEFDGNKANDLLDKRNKLLNELSQKINNKVQTTENNSINITIGGTALIRGNKVNQLEINKNHSNSESTVKFENSSRNLEVESGELKGIIKTRDTVIDNYIDKLDKMAQGFAQKFNEVHQNGFDLNGNKGQEFFKMDSNADHPARYIDLTDTIKSDINKIAAGNYSNKPEVVTIDEISNATDNIYEMEIVENTAGSDDLEITITEKDQDGNILKAETATANKGDLIDTTTTVFSSLNGEFEFKAYQTGEANISLAANRGSGNNAIELANTIKKDNIINENATVKDFYESVISDLGVEAQRANQMVNNQEVLVNQLENQQESIAGVSLDEEMSNMIKYQQAYNAAAKVISNTNKMLDNLMNAIR